MLKEKAETGTIERALARLTDTDQMGELFKVLALGNDSASTPAGFEGMP